VADAEMNGFDDTHRGSMGKMIEKETPEKILTLHY